MAWHIPPHVMERAVPLHTRKELWVHWKWRNERHRLLQEMQEAEMKAKAAQGRR